MAKSTLRATATLTKWVDLVRSRRFWVFLTTSIVVAASERLGLSPEQAQLMAGLAAAWIFGDSYNKTGDG